MTPTPPAPWATPHRLDIQRQIRERPGPKDAHGQQWLEAEPTGLAIALCNCGLNTGWVPFALLPDRAQLEDGDQHAALVEQQTHGTQAGQPHPAA